MHSAHETQEMNLRLALILLLSSLAAIFAAQNIAVIEISFLYWGVSISSALLIFFTLMIGFVMGWFLHGYLLYRNNRKMN